MKDGLNQTESLPQHRGFRVGQEFTLPIVNSGNQFSL